MGGPIRDGVMCDKVLTNISQPATLCETGIAARLERFVRRVCGLRPGRYIITLTVTNDDQAFWTVSELSL